MSYDLALNYGTWDLAIHDNDLILFDDAARVAQQIQITLKFWYGEWFLDTEQGVPYLEYILIKNPNFAHIRQILTEQITGVEGVVTLDSLEFDYNPQERTLDVEYSVTTDYGLIERRVVLAGGGIRTV